jgi:hypothetical protein
MGTSIKRNGGLLACLMVCVVAGTVSQARARGAGKPCTGPAPAAAVARGPALPPYLGFLASAATGILVIIRAAEVG